MRSLSGGHSPGGAARRQRIRLDAHGRNAFLLQLQQPSAPDVQEAVMSEIQMTGKPYRSPFTVEHTTGAPSQHNNWVYYRNQFVDADIEHNADFYLRRMLECVTDTCPLPDTYTAVRKTKQRQSFGEWWSDDNSLLPTFIITVGLIAVVIGIALLINWGCST